MTRTRAWLPAVFHFTYLIFLVAGCEHSSFFTNKIKDSIYFLKIIRPFIIIYMIFSKENMLCP